MATTPPTIARRWIGNTLKQLRESAGKSQNDAVARVGKTDETIRRWECGKSPVGISFIRDLCAYYEASDKVMSRLTSLSQDAKTPGLFEGPHITVDNQVLWENELTATLLRSVELQHIPGLLQTPEYQRALQNAVPSRGQEVEAANRENRTLRQRRVLGQPKPPKMKFAIGRAAIDYMDAQPDVRDGQIARLREIDDMPNAEVKVLHTFHAAMFGSFYLVTPRQGTLGARPFVYMEAAHGARYEESAAVVSQYDEIFSSAFQAAISLEEYLT